MRKELRFIFILLLLSVLSTNVHAAKRYWVGGTSNSWKNIANWSTTSGTGSNASIPGSSDTAVFDGAATRHRCNLDSAVNIKRLSISGDTLSQGSYTITLGSSGGNLTGGVFLGGSVSITVSGAFTIAGCAFTSTSGTFSSSANFTFSSGSFTHNSGKMKFTATNTITAPSSSKKINFYQLEFAPASTTTATISSGDTLIVDNTLTISGSSGLTLNTGTIHAKGNITNSNTALSLGGGSATIIINGTVKQTFTGTTLGDRSRLPNIKISKSSDTLALTNNIMTAGNWTWTSGIIDAGTSIVYFANTTITGNHTLGNVVFYGGNTYTIASGTTLTVKGTLTLGSGGLQPIINTGTIHAKGTVTLASSTNTTSGGGSATIVLNGDSTQSLIGSTTSYSARICNIQINKASTDTLKISNFLTVPANWTYIGGIVSSGSSHIIFSGNRTISGSHTLNSVTLVSSSANTYTISSGTTLTLKGNLTLAGTASITVNTGTINVGGNVLITNTGTGGGGSASLVINGTGNQTLTGNGTAGQGKLPKINIDKSSGTLTLASVITVYGDWIFTKGTVDPDSSTVVLYGTANLDGQEAGSSNRMSFYTLAIAGTITLTGNIDVDFNLSIGNGATLSAGSNSIYCGGTWNNTSGTWTYGTSTVIFDGSTYKQIKRTSGGASATETFYNLSFNRKPASQTLASPVVVNNNLTLTRGHVKTTSSNYLLLIDNATLTGGSDSAYVHGPMRKTGNDAFVFPLGDTTLVDTAYHPLAITAPTVATDQFEATYFATKYTVGDSLVDSLASVSQVEYWSLERKAGTSNVNLTISWNRNSNNATGTDEMTIAQWNNSRWEVIPSSTPIVNGFTGSQSTISFPAVTTPILIVIGNKKLQYQYSPSVPMLDGATTRSYGKKLYVIYDEKYKSGSLNYTLYDMYHTPISTANSPVTKVYGRNWLNINLLPIPGLIINRYYVLEIQNEKGQKEYLRFLLQ